uniref:Uncharacterized protein n=1 Tax=Arundo donax TaxID=35708 RepID=A0A0A8Z807_ARUDO
MARPSSASATTPSASLWGSRC